MAGGRANVELRSEPATPNIARGTATILVVEDELLIRIMLSDCLREAGYNVIEAFNADEAMSILHSGISIELLLTDVRMPGTMDGLGLLEYSLSRFPALPVIITSGHLLPGAATAKGATHFLAKPYAFDLALATVDQALGKAA